MKLSVVIPTLNQQKLTRACFQQMFNAVEHNGHDVEFLIIDNGSDTPHQETELLGASVLRNEFNIGVYPTFEQGMLYTTGDIVAFFHSDVAVWEQGWNTRVIEAFEQKPNLGLLGFIGSNEIDTAGGRGLGTASNFMGQCLDFEGSKWCGSAAEVHGKRLTGYMNGAVVDGCVMILRRTAWERIAHDKDIGPHHFYDKMISCQILEMGYEVGVLGVAFDHFSGQTANQEQKYQDSMEKWCGERGIPKNGNNWDETIYHYSEDKWLREYRDEKKFIPLKI